MASSKDIAAAKKMYASVRPFFRELLEHLCIEANSEKDSIFLSLDKVMKQFWPILRVVCESQGTRPQMQNPDVAGLDVAGLDVDGLEARLGAKPFRQLYHDALDVAFDVKFGNMQEFRKGTPGPKPNVELLEQLLELHPSKSYREIAKEALQAEPEGEAKGLLIEKERERIRAALRRARKSRRE